MGLIRPGPRSGPRRTRPSLTCSAMCAFPRPRSRPSPAPSCSRRRSSPTRGRTPPGFRRAGHDARGRGIGRLVQDARFRGRLRHAHRHLRIPGRACGGPEHGPHAHGPRPAHRQQAPVPAAGPFAARGRHRDVALPERPGQVVRQACRGRAGRHDPERERPCLPQRCPAAGRVHSRGVPVCTTRGDQRSCARGTTS